jgi:hypothetical protein
MVSCLASSSTLKMEATCSSVTVVDFQRTTRRHIPKLGTLQNYIRFRWVVYSAIHVGRTDIGLKSSSLCIRFMQETQREKQEVLGRTNGLLPLIRHGPHWKRRVQQFFYCCVCICYRGNVYTEPLPSNEKGIFIEPLPSNHWATLPSRCLATIVGIHTHTATWSHKPTLFFQNRNVG